MPPRPPKPKSAALDPAVPDFLPWSTGWICALVFISTLAVYWPALGGKFIWDDIAHVTRPDLRSFEGLRRIWFEIGATQQYYPLLHSAFWIEHRWWGDGVFGYHVLNVLLHATAACLFGAVLRRLAVPGAWLAALIFALHPVCVESVAWITEQKNVLSLVFYLGATLAYLRFSAVRAGRQYALATALFVLALLTKTVTATLPGALLVILWWQHGRVAWRRDVLPLLPWFLLGAFAGIGTAAIEHSVIGAQGAAFDLSAIERGLLAGRVIWFYLGKLLWPFNLIFIYPRWKIDAGELWQYAFPLAVIAVLVALWWRRKQRAPLAVALLFVGTLFPVLGFLNVFPFLYSFVADHFQYSACLGIFAGAAAGMVAVGRRWSVAGLRVTAALLLIALGTLTWRQSGTYRDPIVLYETTIARNPACWMAYNNLGVALALHGRTTEAIARYERSLQIRPENAEAENNLGHELSVLGRHEAALPHFHRALQLQPGFEEAYNNLGSALMALRRADEAVAVFRENSRQHPRSAGAQYNLGLTFAQLDRTGEAIPYFARAVQLRPDYLEAEVSWGLALALTERFAESVPHFNRALQLDPNSAGVHETYGRALANAGRFDAAIAQFQEALRIDPGFAAAHLGLAFVFRKTGRLEEARLHYREAQQSGKPPGRR